MLDVMFEMPSRSDVKECVITKGVIVNDEEPLLVYEHQQADDEEMDQTKAG